MHFQSITHLRGIAAISVILFHSTFYAPDFITERLWIGVSVFFVISGFCIANTLDRGKTIPQYTLDRLRRIYPPFLAAVGFTCVFGIVADRLSPGLLTTDPHDILHPFSLTPLQMFRNLTLTEGMASRAWWLGPAWTLGYEVQFYAVAGIALLLPRRYLFPFLALVTALVVTLCAARIKLPVKGTFADGHWLDFAAGIGLYFVLSRRRGVWILVGILCTGILWQAISTSPSKLFGISAVPAQERIVAFSTALALIAVYRYDKAIFELRALKPFHNVGIWSYSLYLIHWPICKAVSHSLFDTGINTPLVIVPCCLIPSLLVGYIFHVLVERRYLKSQAADSHRRTGGAATPRVVAVP